MLDEGAGTAAWTQFPVYTRREEAADRTVHAAGLLAALLGVSWLLVRTAAEARPVLAVAVVVYAAGLLGMLSASAAYNLAAPSPRKAALRRLDRSMIFVMIAGTYTPFALGALLPRTGDLLCGAIWALAGLGIGLEYAAPRLAHRVALPLYLGMGWLIIGLLPALLVAVGPGGLALLLGGGMLYSAGSALHAHGRVPFHNAIWHAMVALAAGLHFVAITRLLPQAG